MIKDGLTGLDFDSIISVPDEVIDRHTGEIEDRTTVYLSASAEDLAELREHLSLNGYDVKWSDDSLSFDAESEQIAYIESILEDRDIVYSLDGTAFDNPEQTVSLMSDVSEISDFSSRKDDVKPVTLEFSGDRENLENIKDKALSLGASASMDNVNGTLSIDTYDNHRDELETLAYKLGVWCKVKEEMISTDTDIDAPLFTDDAVIDEIQKNEHSSDNKPFWTEPDLRGEQLSLFGDPVPMQTKQEQQKSSGRNRTDEDMKYLRNEIMRGTGFQGGKFRMKQFYDDNKPSVKDFAKKLKDEYGTGGHSGDGEVSFANHDSKGIQIEFNDGTSIDFSWNDSAKLAIELIENEQYITPDDINRRKKDAKYTVENTNPDTPNLYDQAMLEEAKAILKEYGIEAEYKPNDEPTEHISDTEKENSTPSSVSVGDRFRNKATGEVSEVVSLTGALPWYTDQCTVSRASGGFVVTENVSYDKLLNTGLYEYIDSGDIALEHTAPEAEVSDKNKVTPEKGNNFNITDTSLGEGGAKTKFKANIAAIETLKMLEKENRPATDEEKETLSKYVGWGGIPQAFLSDGNYEYFNIFLEERNKYVVKYLDILKKMSSDLAEDLQEHRVYIDENQIFMNVLSESELGDKLSSAIGKVVAKMGKSTNSAINRYYNYYYDHEKQERFDMENSTAEKAVIYNAIVGPLNKCFLKIVDSAYGDKYYNSDANGDGNTIHIAQKCSKKLFARSEIQEALSSQLWVDVFRFFKIKRELYQNNSICDYEIITAEESDRADSLYNLYTSKEIVEEDNKKMMAEALVCNPSAQKYYFPILDKYYDEDGELQRLAELMTVDVTSRIEDKLLEIYNNGNIGTLESTLELKQTIIDEQKKYALETSKALDNAVYRQYFLELSRKADEMDKDEVLSQWQSIKEGNNIFVEDKGGYISDEDCILILSRKFRKLHASDYHSVISNLGLTDDTSEGDKNYAFYQEGESYISFENECEKATGFTIERDTDLSIQNYSKDILASGEVMLGYFHYTRTIDVISDGKSMIITNKRIYTKKELFTDFSEISECKPVKKLLLNYLIFEKNDGTKIQLPVSKEIILSAADMINRLLAALKGTEYVANSVEISSSKAMENAKNTVFGAANSAKKGLGSLFGKFGSKSSADSWVCSNCGSSGKGAFCANCGNKRPE